MLSCLQTFVDRLNWMSSQVFMELFSLGQCLPGPTSTQVSFAMGIVKKGVWGKLFPSTAACWQLAHGASVVGPAALLSKSHGWVVVLCPPPACCQRLRRALRLNTSTRPCRGSCNMRAAIEQVPPGMPHRESLSRGQSSSPSTARIYILALASRCFVAQAASSRARSSSTPAPSS